MLPLTVQQYNVQQTTPSKHQGFAGLANIFHGEAGAGGFRVWFFWLAAAWAAECFVSVAIDFLIWWFKISVIHQHNMEAKRAMQIVDPTVSFDRVGILQIQ
jgi:hypothetical protein